MQVLSPLPFFIKQGWRQREGGRRSHPNGVGVPERSGVPPPSFRPEGSTVRSGRLPFRLEREKWVLSKTQPAMHARRVQLPCDRAAALPRARRKGGHLSVQGLHHRRLCTWVLLGPQEQRIYDLCQEENIAKDHSGASRAVVVVSYTRRCKRSRQA